MRRRSINWLGLITGILLVVFGIYTLTHPDRGLDWVVMLLGALAAVMGISDIVFYVKAERYTGFGPVLSLVSGIFSIMAGVMLLVYPGAGKWVMILLLPIWFIAHCVSRISHLGTVRFWLGRTYYHFALAVNIIGIVLGCLMIIWPSILLFSAGILVGIYLLLQGIDSIVMAFNEGGYH